MCPTLPRPLPLWGEKLKRFHSERKPLSRPRWSDAPRKWWMHLSGLEIHKSLFEPHCISHHCIQSHQESSSELESENALSQSYLNFNFKFSWLLFFLRPMHNVQAMPSLCTLCQTSPSTVLCVSTVQSVLCPPCPMKTLAQLSPLLHAPLSPYTTPNLPWPFKRPSLDTLLASHKALRKLC